MVEPYASLIWWVAGCLLVVVVSEVIAAKGASKWGAWRNRLKWVHLPVWVLTLTVLTITDTVAQPGLRGCAGIYYSPRVPKPVLRWLILGHYQR